MERQTYRQRDEQADLQVGKHSKGLEEKQEGRETGRQTERQTKRQEYMEFNKQAGRQAHINFYTQLMYSKGYTISLGKCCTS